METSSISRSNECECVLYTTGKTHQVALVRRMAAVSLVCRNVYAPPTPSKSNPSALSLGPSKPPDNRRSVLETVTETTTARACLC